MIEPYPGAPACVDAGEWALARKRLADPPYPTPGSDTRQPGSITTARAWAQAACQAAARVGPSALMTFSPLRPETSQTSTLASVTNAVSPTHQPAAWSSFRAWSTSSRSSTASPSTVAPECNPVDHRTSSMWTTTAQGKRPRVVRVAPLPRQIRKIVARPSAAPGQAASPLLADWSLLVARSLAWMTFAAASSAASWASTPVTHGPVRMIFRTVRELDFSPGSCRPEVDQPRPSACSVLRRPGGP
jgi:hypothetical protein